MSLISFGLFTFVIPLVLLSTSNCITWIMVFKRKGRAFQNSGNQKYLRNITKVVISVSLLHCISTMPYAIYISISEEMYNELSDIAVYLMLTSYFLNSGFNCIVYCIFGKFFRPDLKELFTGL
jgi:hypothetical protein